MARPNEPRDLIPWTPPPPLEIAPRGPSLTIRDPDNPYYSGYVPPPPPMSIAPLPPRQYPVTPMVPMSQSGVAPEFMRGLSQVGSGPQARAFMRGTDELPMVPPELTLPIADPDVPQDFTSILNRYYPYDEPPPYVPPNPNMNLFRPDVRLDTTYIDDRRRQAPASRMLLDREQRSRGPGPKPSYVLANEGPVVADVIGGRTIVRDPDNPAYTGYRPPAPPAAIPGAPPATVPLSSVYGPLARAYQRGGPQDFNVGDLDVPNPEYIKAQLSVRDTPPSATEMGYKPPEFIYGPEGEVRGIKGRAIGEIPEDTTGLLESATASASARRFFAPLEIISRAISSGQSALDIVTVHADAVIPGPGQGTLKRRYDKYVDQGLPADQAANATMKDYGDALQTLAEDQGAGLGARGGAQLARAIGLVQSVTAPSPTPGGFTAPIAVGFLRKGAKEIAGLEAARIAAADLRSQGLKEAEIVARLKADYKLADDVAARVVRTYADLSPKAMAANKALENEVARRARNAAMGITKEEGTAVTFGAATKKADITDAEQRILELQRERAVTGGKVVEDLPKPKYEPKNNEPLRGMQLEKYPPETQGFMREVAKAIDPVLAQSTRKLSHTDLQDAAQMTGIPLKKVADRLAKRGTSSVDITAVRTGIAVKTTVARDLAAKVASGQSRDPKDVYDAISALQEAAAIQASLHEAASEAGRTLGALRMAIDPILEVDQSLLAYQAAISRIARSPDHANAILQGLLQVGDDPDAIYKLLRSLNKPTHGEQLLSLWNLPRALKASLDLSAAGRQGAILSVAHPGMAADAFRAQIRAFGDEGFANSIDRAIRTSPMQPLREKAGLYLSEIGPAARMTEREEAFLTNLAEKIPGVRASGRAYVTYLNKLRADRFDDAIVAWKRAGVPVTDKRAKLLGEWINIASGRGSFPQWAEGAAPLLNGIFFSPRFAVSRFQAIGFIPYALMKRDPQVALLAAKDLSSFVGANMGLLWLAAKAGADVETDPRSPEFGKIKIGNTVIDTWGGEQQIVRNVAQLWTGERKTATGKNRGDIVPVARNEIAGRFLESKFSPSAGTLWDLGKQVSKADKEAAEGQPFWDQPIGVDFVGESFSAKDLVTSTGQGLLIPMTFGDIYDAVEADRNEGGSGLRGFALGSLSGLGLGVSSYETEEAHGTSPKTRSSGPDVNPYHR